MVETRPSLLLRVRDPADAESWREFVSLYEPLLLAYVRHRGVAEHDARDVVQEVFGTLFRVLPDFALDHDRGRFRTWLWRVTHNALVDWSRRRGRRAAAEDEARKDARVAVEPEEPEEEWFIAHRRRILEFVLEKVREQTSEVTWKCFDLHVRQGRPAAEVGAELGLTSNSVYVNASRVMARVREQCAEYAEDLGEE
jgi:RNA polymerase sigma-70 factor (ECF subfamily)